MTTLNLSKEVLRTLGEGVSRLRDGDLDDGHAANKVVKDMEDLGYVYVGYDFVSRDWCLVVGHLAPTGSDQDALTHEDKQIIRSMADGFGKNPDSPLLFDWSHIRDSSEEAIADMAATIRVLRDSKGLPKEPANLG